MFTLKNILVPTDFSSTSAVALKYARAFAERFDAALHLLHVVDDRFLHAATIEWYPLPTMTYRKDLENAARERLQSWSLVERDELPATRVVHWGNPFLEIIRYAATQNIDLIVMGSHGMGPVAHMLMGSVAEKVVRKAPCPVLTVCSPEHEFVMP